MPGNRSKYPPLERHHLRQIYARSWTADVRTLIWEIARLQRTVLKLADLFLAMGKNRHANRFDGVSQKIVDELFHIVENEPCVGERRGDGD